MLSKENQFEPKTTNLFSRQDSLPEIGSNFEIRESAFALNQNKRYPDSVFETEKGVFVIRWEGQEGIDQKKYDEEKDNYRDMVARMKQQAVFKEWLDSLRKSAKIEHVEAIEGVDAGG